MSPRLGALTHNSSEFRKRKAASRAVSVLSTASSKETRPPLPPRTRQATSWSGWSFRPGWNTFAADELAQLLQRPVKGYVRDHDARGEVAVSGEVLGRAVYHDIRPELQRALQAGRAEGGVHDQGGAGGARNLRYARHVGHTQEGVGDGLYNDGPGL